MSLEIAKQYLAEAVLANSCSVEQLFAIVAANPGKTGEAHLGMMMNNPNNSVSALAKACMLLAMSPFVTFGVGAATVPQRKDLNYVDESGTWADSTVELLVNLANRSLTGHAARDAIRAEMSRLSEDSASLLYRVLVKEMRIGCGPKTVNKHHKGLIPVWEHAGAKRTKEALHLVNWPAWAEYKLDGWRCVVRSSGTCPADEVPETFSRNGLPMENLSYRAKDLDLLTRMMIDCGLLEDISWAWDGEGKKMGEHFNSTSSEASKKGKGAELTFNIFDLVPWSHVGGGDEPIEDRYARRDVVEKFIARHPSLFSMLRVVEVWEVDSEADAWELYNQARELGHEGLIIKQKESLYQPGKTLAWIKVKPEETLDCLVTGTYMGKPGSKYEGMLGGIVVTHKGVESEVGSGLTDKQRKEWADDPSLIIGQVVALKIHEITPAGKLREPRLEKVRGDKNPDQTDDKDSDNE